MNEKDFVPSGLFGGEKDKSRRSFFGKLAALIAAPAVVNKAAVAAPENIIKTETYSLPVSDYKSTSSFGLTTPITTTAMYIGDSWEYQFTQEEIKAYKTNERIKKAKRAYKNKKR
jgi:hypothetical protein